MTKNNAVKPQSLTQESTFKDKPVLALFKKGDEKAPVLKFGVFKAGLILSHLEAIKAFHAKHARAEREASAA